MKRIVERRVVNLLRRIFRIAVDNQLLQICSVISPTTETYELFPEQKAKKQ